MFEDNTKFRWHEDVTVIGGFYRGVKGRVVDRYFSLSKWSFVYTVLDESGMPFRAFGVRESYLESTKTENLSRIYKGKKGD